MSKQHEPPDGFGDDDLSRALKPQAKLPDITLADAERLAKECEYAFEAIEHDANKINWADAGAFFLEGYLHAKRAVNRPS